MSKQKRPSGLPTGKDGRLDESPGDGASSRGSCKRGHFGGLEPMLVHHPRIEELIFREATAIRRSLLHSPVPTAENLLKLERCYYLYRAIIVKAEELHAKKDDEAPLQEVAELYRSARYGNPIVDMESRQRKRLDAKEIEVRSRRQMLLLERAVTLIAEALQCGRNNDHDGFRSIITTKIN